MSILGPVLTANRPLYFCHGLSISHGGPAGAMIIGQLRRRDRSTGQGATIRHFNLCQNESVTVSGDISEERERQPLKTLVPEESFYWGSESGMMAFGQRQFQRGVMRRGALAIPNFEFVDMLVKMPLPRRFWSSHPTQEADHLFLS